MNMIGGALYLAELARQFGFPGAYSAYNAGPGRYLRYVRGGTPLPAETIAYTAQITDGAARPVRMAAAGPPPAPRWQESGLFMVSSQSRALGAATSVAHSHAADPASGARATGLFPLPRSGDTP